MAHFFQIEWLYSMLANTPDHWHMAIGDPSVADAILDRLLRSAHMIHLKGEFMRKAKSRLKPNATL